MTSKVTKKKPYDSPEGTVLEFEATDAEGVIETLTFVVTDKEPVTIINRFEDGQGDDEATLEELRMLVDTLTTVLDVAEAKSSEDSFDGEWGL